ncbi:O-methyltransferase [Candidatus Borrarchaeum sp.]|uniref:O-methyltransferase n=1 Tax=Candidatus Borrarchaeum sp. TaxID=2846742 RepID=UPI0025795A6B|nr:O-methyltransferase [Candidatus Borrarchaeum sp.]
MNFLFLTMAFVINLNQADRVLNSIEELANKKYLPIVGPEKGRVLMDVLREIKPKRVLEIGALIGYSTILMAKELESEARITTIEIDEDEAKIAEENIKKARIKPKIDVIVGDALKILPKLEGEFDLVFIDAAKREYIKYLKLIEDKLHKRSVLVADNAGSFAESMKEYLNYVRSSKKYSSKFVPVGNDGLEITTKI